MNTKLRRFLLICALSFPCLSIFVIKTTSLQKNNPAQVSKKLFDTVDDGYVVLNNAPGNCD